MRITFLVGVATAAAGLLSLAAAYLLRPQDGGEGLPQVVLSLAGLLLGSAGGLLAVCTGAVLLTGFLTRPGTGKARG